jgi:hypothetical protein
MADNLYMVRVYADICLVPRGVGGPGIQQPQSNIGAYDGITQGEGPAPHGQTLRLQQCEMVPNAIATPPTAANFGTALTSAATDLQAQITAAVLTQIQNWATGSE